MRLCWPCSAHALSLYMRIPSRGVRNVGYRMKKTDLQVFAYSKVRAGCPNQAGRTRPRPGSGRPANGYRSGTASARRGVAAEPWRVTVAAPARPAREPPGLHASRRNRARAWRARQSAR